MQYINQSPLVLQEAQWLSFYNLSFNQPGYSNEKIIHQLAALGRKPTVDLHHNQY
jgi:hypothetical protein